MSEATAAATCSSTEIQAGHHSMALNADHLPDETVIRALRPKMVCIWCGHIGADVLPVLDRGLTWEGAFHEFMAAHDAARLIESPGIVA
jgi:hypothetical protein